jgi:hypothetical protein
MIGMTQKLNKLGGSRKAQLSSKPAKPQHPACLLAVALVVLLMTGCNRQSSRSGPEATLPELNQALSVWRMANGAIPTNVCQLTNFLASEGKSLPKPPPGKRLVIDPISGQLVFMNQ